MILPADVDPQPRECLDCGRCLVKLQICFVLFLFCLRFFELCFSVFLVLFCFDFVLFACFCFRRVFEGFNLQLDGIIKSSLSSEENFHSSAEIGFRRSEQRLKEPGERVLLTLSSMPWPTRRGRTAAERQRLRKRRREAR